MVQGEAVDPAARLACRNSPILYRRLLLVRFVDNPAIPPYLGVKIE